MKSVSVPDLRTAIKLIAGKGTDSKVDRRLAFDAVQVLLRGGIFQDDEPKGKLSKNLINNDVSTVSIPKAVDDFLTDLRLLKLKSIGIHFVDPIEGRISTIWSRPTMETEQLYAQTELYTRAWNRIYRRLFRPSATLINAIESGVLPWQWNTVRLAADNDALASATLSMTSFFKDTIELAKELADIIGKHLPENSDAGERRQIEAVFQSAWNDLENSAFITRLNRIAVRFRDAILDDDNTKETFSKYLVNCCGDHVPPPVLKNVSTKDTTHWVQLLDIIQAIQSSILSQPAFCDERGLLLHRVDFANSPLLNDTSVYFIFGQTKEFLKKSQYDDVTQFLNNLGKAIHLLLDSPGNGNIEPSILSAKLYGQIKVSMKGIDYQDDGLKRWLLVVEKLAKEAKHEGQPIKYNVGYGSLAYAQTHLHRYEAVPDDLSKHNVQVKNITSYVKGFYSIFGNRNDRGLWFDEVGQYRGVFYCRDVSFQQASADMTSPSQHHKTVLLAKINGIGFFDIFSREGNQIARVRNGESINMTTGDSERGKAMKDLSVPEVEVIPPAFVNVTKWLVDELIEVLQVETHGTSFVISFDSGNITATNSEWRLRIERQVKTLVKNFSQLDAPLATWSQLTDWAHNWELTQDGSSITYKRPSHLFDLLAEIANLDGGLWLRLSEEKGLEARAAQQFIPLLRLNSDDIRPLDLQMDPEILTNKEVKNEDLPKKSTDKVKELYNLKALFLAINGQAPLVSNKANVDVQKYINALSFLYHSGTKTHSLWGLSLTALDKCLCVVLSTDGKVYIFHDGREFTGMCEGNV